MCRDQRRRAVPGAVGVEPPSPANAASIATEGRAAGGAFTGFGVGLCAGGVTPTSTPFTRPPRVIETPPLVTAGPPAGVTTTRYEPMSRRRKAYSPLAFVWAVATAVPLASTSDTATEASPGSRRWRRPSRLPSPNTLPVIEARKKNTSG